MKLVGLTGGIGTGKSTVSNLFQNLGVKIIDADLLAREVVKEESRGLQLLIEAFGEEILLPEGGMDRKKVGALVFGNEEARKTLNQITHHEIELLRKKRIQDVYSSTPDSIVIYDAPLLIEAQLYQLMQKSILVFVNEATQVKRLIEGRSMSEEEVRARIQSQMPEQKKRKFVDYLIDNNGSLLETESQVQEILEKIQQLSPVSTELLSKFDI